MEHLGFLCAAYSIIFAVIFLYVVFIRRTQSRLESTIGTLEAKLQHLRDGLAKDRGTP